MVFPVVMYGCESWTVKKAECWRTDAFKLWCWRRLLRVPWTARRSRQSILKEISPWCSLEGLMLKLKLQYFGHLMWRADSLEKTLMLGKIEGRRRSGRQRMGWLDGITDPMEMSLSKLQQLVMEREAWRAVVHGIWKSHTWPSHWTELCYICNYESCASQERINMSAFPMGPHIFFQPLSLRLAYLGFSKQCTQWGTVRQLVSQAVSVIQYVTQNFQKIFLFFLQTIKS